jgi:hypothetical protein
MPKFFVVEPDLGYGALLTIDPGLGMKKFRSGIQDGKELKVST